MIGKSTNVFSKLPPSNVLDYDEPYKYFEMKEDGFRTSKLDGSETFLRVSSRIDNYLLHFQTLQDIALLARLTGQLEMHTPPEYLTQSLLCVQGP